MVAERQLKGPANVRINPTEYGLGTVVGHIKKGLSDVFATSFCVFLY